MWTQRRAASSGLVRFRLLLRSSSFGRYLEISESCEGPCHTWFLHRPGILVVPPTPLQKIKLRPMRPEIVSKLETVLLEHHQKPGTRSCQPFLPQTCPEQNLKPGGSHGRKFSPYFVCQRLRTERDIASAWRYFLWVGKQEGYNHGEDTYNLMIQQLCRAKRFSRVFELLEEIRAQRFSLTPTTCVAILRSLVSDNMYGKALAFFRDLGLYGGKVNLAVYSSYLSLLLKAGRYDMIEDTFLVMVHRNIVPDVHTYNNLLSGLRKADQPEKVLRYFDEMKQKGYEANTVTYNIVLRSLGILGRNDEVVEVFCEMSKKELVPTSFTYSALLHIFRADTTSKSRCPWIAEVDDHRHVMWTLCRGKDFASALRTLREMETRGDHIPVSIYNLFAVFLRDAGKVEEVLELFSGMKVRGCEPDTVTYIAAIGAACKTRKADEAFSWHKKMVGKGHTVDVGTWTMLMDVASKTRLVETAFELFFDMQKTWKPEVYTFSILISILCNLQRTEVTQSCLRKVGIRADGITSSERGALEFFHYMKKVTAPDVLVYQILIRAMWKAGKVQECQELVQEMEERGLSPGVVIYSQVLKLLGQAGKVDKAWKLFLRMQSSNMADEVIYAMMIRSLARGGSFVKATKLLEEMERNGFAPNPFAYTALIENLAGAKRFEEAKKLMKEMVRKRCQPDRIGYNSLINTYCKVGKVAQAYSIFLQSIDDGCLPDTKTYNSLIRGYFRFCNTNEAIDMYNVMKNMGSKPDRDTLEILSRGLEEAGRKDELNEVLEEMRQLGVVPPVERL
ncbi:hypothetical protein R1sor_012363 [Riccia sorocarpa]|uniref:Pentatricopeptide repeat-containing protein n=1 Tax=Riccia sorocarpa TaxID=122646 RepID=A0ABD3I697_9MARC